MRVGIDWMADFLHSLAAVKLSADKIARDFFHKISEKSVKIFSCSILCLWLFYQMCILTACVEQFNDEIDDDNIYSVD